MKFTQDWFSHNISNIEVCKSLIPENKNFLKVGSFRVPLTPNDS